MMEDWAERKPSIVFECENIEQTFAAMRDRGVKFPQEPKAMAWGPFAIFVDNDGNWYGLERPANTAVGAHESPMSRTKRKQIPPGEKVPLSIRLRSWI